MDSVGYKQTERFWKRVTIGDPQDCWEWTGSRRSDGYGQTYMEGKHRATHRVSFFALGGMNTQKKTLTTARKKVGVSAVLAVRRDQTVKGRQIWECDRCKVRVVLYIPPVTAPTHRCQKAANQPKELSRKG